MFPRFKTATKLLLYLWIYKPNQYLCIIKEFLNLIVINMCAPSFQNKTLTLRLLVFLETIFLFSSTLNGQTIYNYTLDTATVHISPIPTPVGGLYPPTDLNLITKPLVAEPFSTNPTLVENAGDIHPNAAGVSDVFFGGDEPSTTIAAAQATPIFTKQTFEISDFPIYLETNVYIEENSTNYNECYFWIGPADYQTFCAPRSVLPSPDIQEGILLGGWVNRRIVMNLQSPAEPIVFVKDTMDNATTLQNWYNYQAVLDTLNGKLVFRDLRINNECVFNYPIVIENAPWLENFRLALCVDDLAHGFKIITNYSTLTADFTVSDTIICAGGIISLEANSDFISCHNSTLRYQWQFQGANITSSGQQMPSSLTYANPGVYPIRLMVNNFYDTVSITKFINVIANPLIDLGNDTTICPNSTLLLDAFHPEFIDYLWQNGSTEPQISVGQPGLYFVRAESACSVSTDSIRISTHDLPFSVDLGSDRIICVGDSILLDVTQEGTNAYLWQDGSVESTYIVHTAGSYGVTVSSECSEQKAGVNVFEQSCCNLYVPNIFSPNNDGINDLFSAYFGGKNCINLTSFSLKIFDRWGGLIYQTTDLNDEWNGLVGSQKAITGIYVWMIGYQLGTQKYKHSGDVTLVR